MSASKHGEDTIPIRYICYLQLYMCLIWIVEKLLSSKGWLMEKLLVEIGGVSVIVGAAFAVTKIYSISSLDKRFSKDTNQAFFCAIPVIIYALFRLYCSLLFRITSIANFSLVRPKACKSYSRNRSAEKYWETNRLWCNSTLFKL